MITSGLWAIAVLVVFSSLLVIALVGKPRQPTTGGSAAFTVLINGIVLVIVVLAALGLR